VLLYGWETFSLAFREKYRLRVFENRVLRRILGPKREEDGSWRKFHNDEHHSLYSSPNIFRMIKSRRMRWYRVFFVRSEWKNPLGRPRRRWEDNIKMDLGETGIVAAN
jgi:hypothetical protein